MYQYYEPNPSIKPNRRGNIIHTGDCSVRAFSKAWEKSWDDTAKILFQRALEIKDMPSSRNVLETFLIKSSIKPYKQYDPETRIYKYVYEVAIEEPYKTLIIFTRRHVLCLKNGKVYDTFNSLYDKVCSIYELKDNK